MMSKNENDQTAAAKELKAFIRAAGPAATLPTRLTVQSVLRVYEASIRAQQTFLEGLVDAVDMMLSGAQKGDAGKRAASSEERKLEIEDTDDHGPPPDPA